MALVAELAELAFPDKLPLNVVALIVPAEKLPLPSRLTSWLAELPEVAAVTALTLSTIASLVTDVPVLLVTF